MLSNLFFRPRPLQTQVVLYIPRDYPSAYTHIFPGQYEVFLYGAGGGGGGMDTGFYPNAPGQAGNPGQAILTSAFLSIFPAAFIGAGGSAGSNAPSLSGGGNGEGSSVSLSTDIVAWGGLGGNAGGIGSTGNNPTPTGNGGVGAYCVSSVQCFPSNVGLSGTLILRLVG